MEKRALYTDLIALLYTNDDASLLIDELQAVEKELYKTNVVFEKSLASHISSRFFPCLQELFRTIETADSTVEPYQSLLSSLISEIQALPIVHITFAFDPTPLFISEISQFVRENIAERGLLEITIDKAIIGGFLMDYEGQYWDYSVRTSFDKLFASSNLIYFVNRSGGSV